MKKVLPLADVPLIIMFKAQIAHGMKNNWKIKQFKIRYGKGDYECVGVALKPFPLYFYV